MRKEYDLSKCERGKFFGKISTDSPVIVDADDFSADDLETEAILTESDTEQELVRTNLKS